MKNVLVITGGYCNFDNIDPEMLKADYIIAADSGYENAAALGVRPDLLIGDMDSIVSVPRGIETVKVNAEKDETDTMLAINRAVSCGADQIKIIGGTGGRVDHYLSNIFMLESLHDKGITALLYDGDNMIRYASDETLYIKNDGGYFAVLALEDCVITEVGCKYPLYKSVLRRSDPYAISNEVIGSYAKIKIQGKAIITKSKKPCDQ